MRKKALQKGSLFGLVPMTGLNVICPIIHPLNAIAYHQMLGYGTICGLVFGFIGYELCLKQHKD
ncbi:MAG: hypothetical protein KBT48_04680 [Firmicutes bacterium]|nr:hypothetical protein [Bacillota bacterium]